MNKDGCVHSEISRSKRFRLLSALNLGLALTALVFIGLPQLCLGNEFLIGFGTNEHGEISPPFLTNGIVSLDAGYSHAVASGVLGVFAWGENISGEGSSPITLSNIVQVSAGFRHNLALSGDGTVMGWGANGYGQTTVPETATNIVQISAGGFHSLALSASGKVFAWGQGTYGQSVVPASATNIASVAAGAYHNIALRSDGRVLAWGNNGNGQLNVPTTLTNAAAVASGFFHNLAIRSNGTVVAWGWNQFGQCAVPADLTNVIAVAAGYRHSVALRSDGRIVTWGDNSAGEWIGTNDAANVTAISAGADFSLLRVAGLVVTKHPVGSVFTPGTNYTFTAEAVSTSPLSFQWQREGVDIPDATNTSLTLTNLQLTDSGNYRAKISSGSSIVFTRVASLIFSPIITQQPQGADVYYGSNAVFTVTSIAFPSVSYQWYFNGNAITGGTNATLVLSNTTYSSAGDYKVIASNLVGAVSSQTAHLNVQTAPFFSFGGQMTIPYDGAATLQIGQAGVSGDSYQWQYEGQDIVGATNTWLPLTNARPAHAGHYRYASITEAGALYSPEMTISVDRANPVNFAGRRIQLDGGNGLGMITGWQWLHHGTNISDATNQLFTLDPASATDSGDYSVIVSGPGGPRELMAARLTVLPEPIPGELRMWGGAPPNYASIPDAIQVSAGARHVLVLDADGSVSGFGDNGCGAITIPAALSNCVSVAGGEYNSMGLRADGRVIFFGNCSCTTCASPVIERAVKISMGSFHALAVLNDGTVGFAGEGVAPPAGLSNVVDVAAGSEHSIALKADGTVVGWGDNSRGQLNIPTGLNSVTAIAAGSYHTLALRSDGTVVAWGLDGSGQCDVPPGLTGVSSIRAGALHSLAIRTNGTVIAWGIYDWYGPVTVPADLTNVVDADGARSFSVAIQGSASRPAILQHPSNTTNNAGSTVVFSVTARSTAPLSYQWQFESTPIPGATNTSLVLTNITGQMQGNYSVLVSTPDVTIESRAAYLFVIPGPFLQAPAGTAGAVIAWGRNIYGETNVPVQLTNAVAIASGSGALDSFAFRSDGTLVRWGGGVGLAPDVTNLVAVSGCANYNLGLQNNGTVSIWGLSDYTSMLPGVVGVKAISAGGTKIALLTNGTVIDLGNSGLLTGISNAVAIAAGGGHALALKQDGTVALSAYNYPYSEQTPVPAGLSNVIAIAAGDNHSLALCATGTVIAWGRNAEGQCSVPPNLTNVVAIAAAGNHSLALKSDRTVVVWGDSSYGLNQIPSSVTNVIAIAAGWQYDLALRAGPIFKTTPTNVVAAYGSDVLFTAAASAPSPVTYQWLLNGIPIEGATNAVLWITNAQVSSVGEYQIVAQADGFSANAISRLAFGNLPTVISAPESVWALPGTDALFQISVTNNVQLFYQWFHDGQILSNQTNNILLITNVQPNDAGNYAVEVRTVLGLETNASANLNVLQNRPMGRVIGWGSDTNIPAGLSGVVAIAAGDNHSLALRADGTVVAWGSNAYGQTNVPAGLSDVVAISGGGRHSLALRRDGTMVGWGHNYNGQASPPGITGARAIAGGGSYSAAIDSSGGIIAWGNSYAGTLATPSGVTNATDVAAGMQHGIARRADGTVLGWGDDSYGQVSGPATVSNVVAVAAGHFDSMVLKNDGTVLAFGIDFYGETNVPAGVSNVVSIATQYGRCLVAKSDGTIQEWGLDIGGRTTPPFPLTNIVQVAAGADHSLALQETGCYLIRSLKNTNVLIGKDVTLEVLAVGVSPLQYQWQFNGANIPFATNRLLSITGVQLTNSGTYSVTIQSTKGSEFSSALLTVLSPPIIVTPPQDQTVLLGSNAAFSVSLAGTAPFRIFWQKSEINLAGATNATLTLTNVMAGQAGFYRVVVTNVYGAVTSAPVALTVNEPPRILQPPVSQITPVASQAAFNVVASGTQPLSVQWKKDGQLILTGTNLTLIIPNVQTNDAGMFVVEITNSFGAVTSAPVSLTVMPQAPTILQQPSSADVQLGTTATLSVAAVGTIPLRYQWQFNGTNLPGATATSLSLSNFSFAQRGNYCVLVSNDFGNVLSQTATLNFKLPPNVIAWGSNQLKQLAVPADLTNAVAISAGDSHNLAIRSDQTVVAWGDNSSGQCNVPAGLSNVVAVSAGTSHSLALLSDGTVVGWGATNSIFGEATVPPGLTNVSGIKAASAYSLAVLRNGSVTGWGYSAWGAGTPPSVLSNVVAVAAGAEHAVALLSNKTVVGWGNYYGEPNGLTNVVAIGSSLFEFMALRDDGRIVSWTSGNYGQTKYAGPTNAVAIAGGGSSLSISSGGTTTVYKPHFLGVMSNGTVSVWGDNPGGIFTPPAGLSNVVSIAAGFSHNLALVRGPFILQGPTSQVVEEGQPVILTVIVAQPDSSTYQWSHNGVAIPGATNVTLIIDHAVFSDSGLYTVKASDGFGLVGSAPASISIIPTLPIITQQPVSTNVTEGGFAQFNVLAVGSGHLNYRWLFNGSTILGATNSFLTISNATVEHCGIYSVVVGNSSGFALSSNAMLTLSVGAIILDNPNATVTGGWSNLVGLQCFGTNSLMHAQGFGDSKVQYSGTVPKSGSYRVYEWNPAALNRSGSVPLAVETAAGTMFLNFSQSLSSGTWVLVGTFPFTTNSPATLTIYDNCPEAGRVVLADAFRLLYAPAPPTFVSQPANQTIDCGQPAAFSASATGTQPIAFQWQKNGINIKDATNSTLNLPAVALWDAGAYTLLAANADGTTISQSAQLSVTAPHLNAYASQDHVVMEWIGTGVLQTATNISGPYVDLPNALSPFVVDPGEPQRYFRMRLSTLQTGPSLRWEAISGSLTWDRTAVLQTATNLFGPYVDVPAAMSPYPIDATIEPERFFRLKY